MAVRFVLGRSGSGKTSYCISSAADALVGGGDQQLLLLVPEQATYQAERSILGDERISGYHRLKILSFDRLQYLVLGRNTARPALSRLGREMAIRRILKQRAEDLQVLGTSAWSAGLSRQLADTIAELHRYAMSGEDVERLICELKGDERHSLSAMKFADIGLILAEYTSFIDGRFVDSEAQLNRACVEVKRTEFAIGARLWVDGFAGFTTAETAVLAELLKTVSDAEIALCMDPEGLDLGKCAASTLDDTDMFYPVQKTYCDLREIAGKCGLKVEEPVVLSEPLRFEPQSGLSRVERELFVPGAGAGQGRGVRIVGAANARAEARVVGREILKLVRRQGYRFRDIAVIVSDLDGYEHYIRAYFEDYGIQFFIDKRRPLSQHSLAQLINCGLQMGVSDFSRSDVFTYLKTDLVGLDRMEVDVLENYCVAYGVGPGDWFAGQRWSFAAGGDGRFDEERVNEIRQKIEGPLGRLRERLGASVDSLLEPGDFVRAVFAFLEELGVRRTIETWIAKAVDRGDHGAVDEHRQFYEKLVDVFDELQEVFTGCRLTAGECVDIVKTALSQMTLAFIPPTLDQVLVGSVERSRHPDLKAVFVMGATQKQFPVPITTGGVLSDDDRRLAESFEFPLGPGTSGKLAERRYLAYIAFTRPSELLTVSYPLADEKGAEVARSQFVDDLARLFQDSERMDGGECGDLADVVTEGQLAEVLCRKLGRDRFAAGGGVPAGLVDAMANDPELARTGREVRYALDYDNDAVLDAPVIEPMFGRRLRASASRLQTFAACPYQYYAKYVLGLEKRREFRLEPLDVGAFYHEVLDALMKRLAHEGKDIAGIDPERLGAMLDETVAAVIENDSFLAGFQGRTEHNAFIIESACSHLRDCVWAISAMVGAGRFRPRYSEVGFGAVDSDVSLGELIVDVGDGRQLSLDGKIDRLDVARVDGNEVAAVFDYKLSDRIFNWAKFYHGLDLQLVIYMLAVRECTQSPVREVAGAFYMPIRVGASNTTAGGLETVGDKCRYKAKGLFNGEYADVLESGACKNSEFYSFYVGKDGQPYGDYGRRSSLKPVDFENTLRYASEKIASLGGEMLGGDVRVRPFRMGRQSPCGYCDYKSVCRFDWQVNEYNTLETPGKKDVLARLEDSDGV